MLLLSCICPNILLTLSISCAVSGGGGGGGDGGGGGWIISLHKEGLIGPCMGWFVRKNSLAIRGLKPLIITYVLF